jgi:hypothetical protein
MSALSVKNSGAWRDRPDTVLISIRRDERSIHDLRWTPLKQVVLVYQILGTRAGSEASNGGAPVDPGVYGPETIVTAWDLGLSQRRLLRLLAHSPPSFPAFPTRTDNSFARYERKIAQKIVDRFLPEAAYYKHEGARGIGRVFSDFTV